MLKVIGHPFTRAGRLLWTLEELGLEYEMAPVKPHTPEVNAVNPFGKVPNLVTDDGVITDSVAAMSYLADREGKLTHKAGTFARAQQDSVTLFALDQIEAPLWMAAKHAFVFPEAMRVAEVKEPCRAEASRGFEAFAKLLADREYAAGDMFTIADILIGHCSNWARSSKVPLPTEGPVADYLGRILSRPAFKASIARGKAEAEAAA